MYFEIAGSGGLGSINYEHPVASNFNFPLRWRAGISLAPIDKNNGVGVVIPLMIHACIGKNSHQLDLGIGQGITVTTKGSFFALATVSMGYRYQPKNENWFYRVSYTPLISYWVDFQLQHWAGVSIGRTFKN